MKISFYVSAATAVSLSVASATTASVSVQNLDGADGLGNDIIILSPTDGSPIVRGSGSVSIGYFGAAAFAPGASFDTIVGAFRPFAGPTETASSSFTSGVPADGFFAIGRTADIGTPAYSEFLTQTLAVLIQDDAGNAAGIQFTGVTFEDTAAENVALNGPIATDAAFSLVLGSDTGDFTATINNNPFTFQSITLAQIPEPSSTLLLGGSLLALGFRRRRA